jgi:hypothetical protein
MKSDSLIALAMHDVQDNDQNSENQHEHEKERLSHFLLWCIAIQWRARCCGHNSTAWKTEGGALRVRLSASGLQDPITGVERGVAAETSKNK